MGRESPGIRGIRPAGPGHATRMLADRRAPDRVSDTDAPRPRMGELPMLLVGRPEPIDANRTAP
jgi:hypothetical protein